MKTLEERLGHRIAIQRKALGFSQSQFAERIDVQPETISRIENGRRAASLRTIERISEALQLKLYEIFFLLEAKNAKDCEVEKLMWYVARLSAEETVLFLDVGSELIASTRRAKSNFQVGEVNICPPKGR
jgi:transcriptional regulator with XRE-family HTH domain